MSREAELDMKWAVAFVERIGKLINLAGLYDYDNVTVVKAIEDLVNSLGDATLGDAPVQLQCVMAVVYINGARVRLPEALLETAVLLRRVLEPLSVQEISFSTSARVVDVQAMLKALKESRRVGALALQNVAGGAIVFRRVQSNAERKPPEQILKEAFARFTTLCEEIAEGEVPATHRFRRLLQVMADASGGREALLVALARSEPINAAAGHHAAAVACLTLMLARECGVSAVEQVNLALHGALHDVSWGRPAPALDGRRLRLRGPLGVGIRLIGDRDDALSEAFVVSAEATRSNRPAVGQWAPPLSSQLIGVSCTFMALVCPATPAVGMAADHAMQMLLATDRFDPRVVRLFVRIVGLLPVGSVVELPRGHKGVVLRAPTDASAARSPTVRVLHSGEIVDLAARGEQVIRVLAPWEYDVNPTAFVFA